MTRRGASDAVSELRAILRSLTPARRVMVLTKLLSESAALLDEPEPPPSLTPEPTPTEHAQLTEKQRAILAWVRKFQSENHVSPSLREIAAAFGLSSSNAAREHLERLIAKGYITKATNRHRGIRVVEDSRVEGE